MSIRQVFERIRGAMESVGIPYMVTGSFASSAHGVPRSTNDIDIVIAPTQSQLLALLAAFPESEYCSSREAAIDALRRRSQFNVIDQNSSWKIDFIIQRNREFSVQELGRRVMVEIAGVHLYAATPEDVLISKLEWAKQGESERQISDAAGIIRVQGPDLDTPYLERWVAALDMAGQWRAASEKARL